MTGNIEPTKQDKAQLLGESESMPLLDAGLPNTLPDSDRVTVMRDRFISFKKHYEGMLYFCSRVTGYSENKISMLDLKQFEVARFHRHEQFVKNHSWPVSAYLAKIKELEQKITELSI